MLTSRRAAAIVGRKYFWGILFIIFFAIFAPMKEMGISIIRLIVNCLGSLADCEK